MVNLEYFGLGNLKLCTSVLQIICFNLDSNSIKYL